MEHQAVVEFVGPWTGPLVATSVHAGHDLRPEIAAAMTLSEDDRFREEDPSPTSSRARSSLGCSPIARGSRSH